MRIIIDSPRPPVAQPSEEPTNPHDTSNDTLQAALSAVSADPQNWVAHLDLASELSLRQDHAGALREGNYGVELSPEQPRERASALIRLAQLVLLAGDRRQAAAIAASALTLQPTNSVVITWSADFARRAGRHVEAIRIASTDPHPESESVDIAKLAVFQLTARLVGWLLVVAFATALTFIGILGQIVDTQLAARLGGIAGLLGFAAVITTTLRPLTDLDIAASLWQFARRSVRTVIAGIAILAAAICYALLAINLAQYAGIALPFGLMLITRIIHWSVFAPRAPR